jgi:elongation factor P
LDDEALGDAAAWLTPNMVILAEFYEGKPIGVELPNSLELTVAATEPAARGDTKTAVTKPAKLENGITVQVPPFVNEGDVVRVDPRESKYIERVLR